MHAPVRGPRRCVRRPTKGIGTCDTTPGSHRPPMQVVAPHLASLTGERESKLAVVGVANLLSSAPQLMAPEATELSGKLLDAALKFLEGTSTSSAGASGAVGRVPGGAGLRGVGDRG